MSYWCENNCRQELSFNQEKALVGTFFVTVISSSSFVLSCKKLKLTSSPLQAVSTLFELDVYSFGRVLYEISCGQECPGASVQPGDIPSHVPDLVSKWRRHLRGCFDMTLPGRGSVGHPPLPRDPQDGPAAQRSGPSLLPSVHSESR